MFIGLSGIYIMDPSALGGGNSVHPKIDIFGFKLSAISAQVSIKAMITSNWLTLDNMYKAVKLI
jgi:hypothetical protein